MPSRACLAGADTASGDHPHRVHQAFVGAIAAIASTGKSAERQ
ncbi:MAG: hypothetical protein U0744_06215 [Gemmataceae bacterium]